MLRYNQAYRSWSQSNVILSLPENREKISDIWLHCFSKEISGFAALKRTIREVENGLVDKSGNKSQIRVHKKKKDAMVSPKATKWLDSISQWEIEIG